MRKESITAVKPNTAPPDATWLDLDSIAIVQVASEQEGYPIDGALLAEGKGWRAASEGTQRSR